MTGDDTLDDLLARIGPLDGTAMDEARARWGDRAKPPGSLGRLEHLAVHVAGITGACPPDVPSTPAVTVFAGDHGVVADGASAWPSEVTGFMVATMAAGGAAVNALATAVGASVTVVDVGVATDPDPSPGVVHARVRPGTASIAREPAMSREEVLAAMRVGAEQVAARLTAGADLLVGGDMGIGNTTPSAALVARCTGRPAAAVVGPGAGATPEGLARKVALVDAALTRAAGTRDPVDVLVELGGLEIAALTGFHLAAAAAGVPAIADGVIALAALCVADAIAPGTAARTIAGHRSTEPAATAALDHLGMHPLLELDLRLGEGTGACLAIPLVQAATRALRDMAALPGAG